MWGLKSNRSGLVRYFHRIPECLGLEGILKTIYFQLPATVSLFLALLAAPVTPAPGTGMFLARCSPGNAGNSQRNPAESGKETMLLI